MPSSAAKTTVLLLSTSDLWTVSARSILASLPGIELLDTAHGSLTAYQMVVERCPHVLIIDDSLPSDEAKILVANIKTTACPPYCIWIVATNRQKKQTLPHAADAIITRSGSSQDLITAVLSARNHINFNHSTA